MTAPRYSSDPSRGCGLMVMFIFAILLWVIVFLILGTALGKF